MARHMDDLYQAVAQIKLLPLLEVKHLAIIGLVANPLVSWVHPYLREETVTAYMIDVVVTDDHIQRQVGKPTHHGIQRVARHTGIYQQGTLCALQQIEGRNGTILNLPGFGIELRHREVIAFVKILLMLVLHVKRLDMWVGL